eukprot:CAMPEP_0117657234 /NCGR_PEP_ID=MMETSP0804-20121206/5222_1 /TAXON_ID=1074897 /ORGANISM="Tetraselmis astigmatica, Strain CCMP880" /LENGTH=141 /DNA_ID=CAMNT_0005463675 /DNA_START=178 /DNA_END=601 /DNA_ORIENTATION=+
MSLASIKSAEHLACEGGGRDALAEPGILVLAGVSAFAAGPFEVAVPATTLSPGLDLHTAAASGCRRLREGGVRTALAVVLVQISADIASAAAVLKAVHVCPGTLAVCGNHDLAAGARAGHCWRGGGGSRCGDSSRVGSSGG